MSVTIQPLKCVKEHFFDLSKFKIEENISNNIFTIFVFNETEAKDFYQKVMQNIFNLDHNVSAHHVYVATLPISEKDLSHIHTSSQTIKKVIIYYLSDDEGLITNYKSGVLYNQGNQDAILKIYEKFQSDTSNIVLEECTLDNALPTSTSANAQEIEKLIKLITDNTEDDYKKKMITILDKKLTKGEKIKEGLPTELKLINDLPEQEFYYAKEFYMDNESNQEVTVHKEKEPRLCMEENNMIKDPISSKMIRVYKIEENDNYIIWGKPIKARFYKKEPLDVKSYAVAYANYKKKSPLCISKCYNFGNESLCNIIDENNNMGKSRCIRGYMVLDSDMLDYNPEMNYDAILQEIREITIPNSNFTRFSTSTNGDCSWHSIIFGCYLFHNKDQSFLKEEIKTYMTAVGVANNLDNKFGNLNIKKLNPIQMKEDTIIKFKMIIYNHLVATNVSKDYVKYSYAVINKVLENYDEVERKKFIQEREDKYQSIIDKKTYKDYFCQDRPPDNPYKRIVNGIHENLKNTKENGNGVNSDYWAGETELFFISEVFKVCIYIIMPERYKTDGYNTMVGDPKSKHIIIVYFNGDHFEFVDAIIYEEGKNISILRNKEVNLSNIQSISANTGRKRNLKGSRGKGSRGKVSRGKVSRGKVGAKEGSRSKVGVKGRNSNKKSSGSRKKKGSKKRS